MLGRCGALVTMFATLLVCAAPAGALPVTFTEPTLRTIANPRTIAIADFNADGDPDLAVASQTGNTVAVLLGEAGAGFPQSPIPFGVGLAPYGVAVANFGGGQNLDLAVTNFDAGTVSVLLGGTNPLFGAKSDYPAGAGARAVAIGQFNAGTDPDLAVAN